MLDATNLISIGHIVRTHGTDGVLQCRMINSYWEQNDAEFIILRVEGLPVPFRVIDWRTKGQTDVLLTLRNITTEQQALRFVGCEALMQRNDIAETQQSDMTDPTELIGYTIHDLTSGYTDIITRIDTSTINTLVELSNGQIIPLHEDLIEELHIPTRQLSVRLPQGLIDIDENS